MSWSDGFPRIMVTGSRGWTDRKTIELCFEPNNKTFNGVTLIHGGAPGADRMAAEVARTLGWAVEEYPADWTKGIGAGLIRNQQMVDSKPDLVIAFWDGKSRGTLHAITRAVLAGIQVRIYPEGCG